MSDFLQSAACLVGRRVKVCVENPRLEGMSMHQIGMLEDVLFASQAIKLEGRDPFPVNDVCYIRIENPDFSKRADRQ